MESTYLLIFGIIGWSLSLYFGFFRYKQYRWSRAKVHYDLFNKLNQRSNAIFLKLSVLQSLPRNGKKGQTRFASLQYKFLEVLNEKLLHVGTGQLPAPLIVFWLESTQRELNMLHQRDPGFLTELATIADKTFAQRREPFSLLFKRLMQTNALGRADMEEIKLLAKKQWTASAVLP